MKKFLMGFVAGVIVLACANGAAQSGGLIVRNAPSAEYVNVRKNDGNIDQFIVFQPKAQVKVLCTYRSGMSSSLSCAGYP